MARCNNWPAELAAFMAEREKMPFDWRTNNCALFACDWILRLTGIDPAAGLRKKCRSAKSGAAVLKAEGGMLALASARCAAHGWPVVPHRMAQRGDVILADVPGVGLTLGVCCGGQAAFPGATGRVYHPMSVALVAWRIT